MYCPLSGTDEEGSLRVSSTLGHLEIFHNGQWGTICDDQWKAENSKVACRQLGYRFVNRSFTAEPLTGTSPIWMDDVQCIGTEESLVDCDRKAWGENNCQLTENIGVECFDGNYALLQYLLHYTLPSPKTKSQSKMLVLEGQNSQQS